MDRAAGLVEPVGEVHEALEGGAVSPEVGQGVLSMIHILLLHLLNILNIKCLELKID